ncbi:hypothetical protein CCUS01_10583 [Colletotrichum cuscutae]|uniref:Uncharacterized protein n=1 Tax=Colletotrichum cuscutae TaxID=1209917 RepID=A0AAI9UBN4_9PEZI|nr:hypothetical protein CCUS01_10583 [Colletotrichum cuscutae]
MPVRPGTTIRPFALRYHPGAASITVVPAGRQWLRDARIGSRFADRKERLRLLCEADPGLLGRIEGGELAKEKNGTKRRRRNEVRTLRRVGQSMVQKSRKRGEAEEREREQTGPPVTGTEDSRWFGRKHLNSRATGRGNLAFVGRDSPSRQDLWDAVVTALDSGRDCGDENDYKRVLAANASTNRRANACNSDGGWCTTHDGSCDGRNGQVTDAKKQVRGEVAWGNGASMICVCSKAEKTESRERVKRVLGRVAAVSLQDTNLFDEIGRRKEGREVKVVCVNWMYVSRTDGPPTSDDLQEPVSVGLTRLVDGGGPEVEVKKKREREESRSKTSGSRLPEEGRAGLETDGGGILGQTAHSAESVQEKRLHHPPARNLTFGARERESERPGVIVGVLRAYDPFPPCCCCSYCVHTFTANFVQVNGVAIGLYRYEYAITLKWISHPHTIQRYLKDGGKKRSISDANMPSFAQVSSQSVPTSGAVVPPCGFANMSVDSQAKAVKPRLPLAPDWVHFWGQRDPKLWLTLTRPFLVLPGPSWGERLRERRRKDYWRIARFTLCLQRSCFDSSLLLPSLLALLRVTLRPTPALCSLHRIRLN